MKSIRPEPRIRRCCKSPMIVEKDNVGRWVVRCPDCGFRLCRDKRTAVLYEWSTLKFYCEGCGLNLPRNAFNGHGLVAFICDKCGGIDGCLQVQDDELLEMKK